MEHWWRSPLNTWSHFGTPQAGFGAPFQFQCAVGFAASNSLLTAWDLVTLAPAWSLNLVPSINLNLLACPHNPLVALVQKEQVLLLNVASGAIEHKLDDA